MVRAGRQRAGLRGAGRSVHAALQAEALAFVSLQKSALVVQGPREVKKRELVFLQFRLNQSSEDFSAIDYLLFSSFQEFLHRWPFLCYPPYSDWGGRRGWGVGAVARGTAWRRRPLPNPGKPGWGVLIPQVEPAASWGSFG